MSLELATRAAAEPPSGWRTVMVTKLGSWLPPPVPEAQRQQLDSLGVVDFEPPASGQPDVQSLVPPLCMRVAVGTPRQWLTLVLDTTGGGVWLADAGSLAVQEGLLQASDLYHSLNSSSVQFVAQAEVSPRTSMPALGVEIGARSLPVKGKAVSDRIELLGASWRQAVLLAERWPGPVLGWRAAGVLGLGLQSNVTIPVLQTWRRAMTAVAPAPSPEPEGLVLSLWPEGGDRSTSRSPLRLSLGLLQGASWVNLLPRATAWAVSGGVAAGAAQWPATLVIDSTLPCVGVPNQLFPELIRALLPGRLFKSCWWSAGGQVASFPRMVQCDCQALTKQGGTPLLVTVAGQTLELAVHDLFAAGEVCTARVCPLMEPASVTESGAPLIPAWHLGEPFLRRHAISLDASRLRLGFRPQSPSEPVVDFVGGVLEALREVSAEQSQDERDNAVSVTEADGGMANVLFYMPVLAFVVLFMFALVAVLRGASNRWRKQLAESTRREWLAVATADYDSDLDLAGGPRPPSPELGRDRDYAPARHSRRERHRGHSGDDEEEEEAQPLL